MRFRRPAGALHPEPDACTDQLEAVCGCDGVTYANPSEAQVAGMSVRATGACMWRDRG